MNSPLELNKLNCKEKIENETKNNKLNKQRTRKTKKKQQNKKQKYNKTIDYINLIDSIDSIYNQINHNLLKSNLFGACYQNEIFSYHLEAHKILLISGLRICFNSDTWNAHKILTINKSYVQPYISIYFLKHTRK